MAYVQDSRSIILKKSRRLFLRDCQVRVLVGGSILSPFTRGNSGIDYSPQTRFLLQRPNPVSFSAFGTSSSIRLSFHFTWHPAFFSAFGHGSIPLFGTRLFFQPSTLLPVPGPFSTFGSSPSARSLFQPSALLPVPGPSFCARSVSTSGPSRNYSADCSADSAGCPAAGISACGIAAGASVSITRS